MTPGFEIDIYKLRNKESELRKLAKELARIENALGNIKTSLDRDVRNERGIDKAFSDVCNDVGNEERDLTKCADFIGDAVKAYQDAEKRNKLLINGLLRPATFQNQKCMIPGTSWATSQSTNGVFSNPYINQWQGFNANPWLPYSYQGVGVYKPLWIYPSNITPNMNYLKNNGVTLNNQPVSTEQKVDNVTGDWLGYEYKEPKGYAAWDFKNNEVGIGGNVGIEAYLGKGEVKGEIGVLSGNLSGTVGQVGAQAEAKAALFSDGQFDPELSVKAKAEAYGIKGAAEGQVGNEDYNLHAGAEGAVGAASAEASAFVNKDGVGANVGASAAVFKGEVKTGFTLFGINVDLSAEGEAISAGAEANFGVTKDEIEVGGKLSLLAGLGAKLKISW